MEKKIKSISLIIGVITGMIIAVVMNTQRHQQILWSTSKEVVIHNEKVNLSDIQEALDGPTAPEHPEM